MISPELSMPVILRHYDAITVLLRRVVQESVNTGVCVVKETVLAGSAVAVISHRDPAVVDSEVLGKPRPGLGRDAGNRWIGNRSSRKVAGYRAGRIAHEAVGLSVRADIKADQKPVAVDSLRIDKVRT